VRSEYEFYILRFLLGVAEAGLVPGVILYLTFWFPANRRAGMVAIFLAAIPASGIIGAPLSGFLMNLLNDWNGLAGWKWMFLLEGIPSVLVGLAAYWYLDNGPEQANWLTTAERSIVKERLDYETKAQIDVGGHVKVWTALGSLRFWALTVIYFGSVMGVTGLAFWLPQIVRDLGVTNLVSNGLITSLPYIAAAIGMLIVGWSSDRTGERRWHYAISSLVGGLGLVVAGTSSASNPTLSVIGLALAAAGIYGGLAIFWSMSTSFLQGVAAAAGIAVINSISNLGGFVGPQMIGIVRDATHRTDFGLYFIAVFLVLSGAITLSLPKPVVRLDQVPMGETKDIGVSVLSET